jgi:hypothetical protein
MRKLILLTFLATPAFAEEGIKVRLPDNAAIEKAATKEFMTELVQAIVIGNSCDGIKLTEGELALLTQTSYKVGEALPPEDKERHDSQYYGPAYGSLNHPDTCPTGIPKIEPLLDRLKAMGGGTDPVG